MQRLSFFLALVLLIPSCGRAPEPAVPEQRRIVVCATVYPLATVAREIGGDLVRVDWILDLGDPIQFFQATLAERERMSGVDLLFCEGLRTDAWASQVIGSLQEAKKVLALEQMGVARTTPSTGLLWLDPIVVREAAGTLAELMAEHLPEKRAIFLARAKAFTEKMDVILKAHPNSVFGRGRVLVLSTQFDALLDRFGVSAVMVDANPLRLADADFPRLQSIARREQIKSILVPFDTPPGTIADLEARTGLTAYRIDHLGLPEYAGHATYLEILDYNLLQLEAATR